MPIQSMTTTPLPGHLVHRCASCGASHRISFDRGGQKSRTGPFALAAGATLVLRVDAGEAITVTLVPSDVAEPAPVTAAELAAKLNDEVAGLLASDDVGGLLLESKTTGASSRLEVLSGTACATLGLATEARPAHNGMRPVLGVSVGAGDRRDPSVLALRPCSDCGAREYLVRSFEAAPNALRDTHFASHRRAVNSLAQHCLRQGWSHPEVSEVHAAETAVPHDLDTEFPHRPCVLHHRPDEHGEAR